MLQVCLLSRIACLLSQAPSQLMWLLQVPLTHAALEWCAGLQLEHQQLRSLNPSQDGALIYRADMQSTLHEVVLYGFLQPNAAGYTHVSRTAAGVVVDSHCQRLQQRASVQQHAATLLCRQGASVACSRSARSHREVSWDCNTYQGI